MINRRMRRPGAESYGTRHPTNQSNPGGVRISPLEKEKEDNRHNFDNIIISCSMLFRLSLIITGGGAVRQVRVMEFFFEAPRDCVCLHQAATLYEALTWRFAQSGSPSLFASSTLVMSRLRCGYSEDFQPSFDGCVAMPRPALVGSPHSRRGVNVGLKKSNLCRD